MPGYGVPETMTGATPWRWAEAKLVNARNYFIATTRPDGRPHLMPIWGLWIDGLFAFSTSITSVKSRNLVANASCAVTIEDGHHCVLFEGEARITQLSEVPGFIEAYGRKYGKENTGPIGDGPIWTVKPTIAFVFKEDETFSTSATRWEF